MFMHTTENSLYSHPFQANIDAEAGKAGAGTRLFSTSGKDSEVSFSSQAAIVTMGNYQKGLF